MAKTPGSPISPAIPFAQSVNLYGSLYIGGSGEYLDANQHVVYRPVIDPQTGPITNAYGIVGQLAYDTTLKSLCWHDGTSWIYPSLVNNNGFNYKPPVITVADANITLSGTQTINGVSLVAGDRVLVTEQSDHKYNGIYEVAAGAWSRTYDADESDELPGAFVVCNGNNSTYDNTIWLCTTNLAGFTIGTNSNDWLMLDIGTYDFRDGLTESAHVVDVNVPNDGAPNYDPTSGLMIVGGYHSGGALDVNLAADGALEKTGGLSVKVDGTTIDKNASNQLYAKTFFQIQNAYARLAMPGTHVAYNFSKTIQPSPPTGFTYFTVTNAWVEGAAASSGYSQDARFNVGQKVEVDITIDRSGAVEATTFDFWGYEDCQYDCFVAGYWEA